MLTKLQRAPTSIAGGAIYPNIVGLLDSCERKLKYKDEAGNDTYNLARVIGTGAQSRIWVPRNMSPLVPPSQDLRTNGLPIKFQSSFVARNSEQTRCISECVDLLRRGENFLFQAPPGFGKTVCGAEIIARMGLKTCVIVTKEDIIDQWVEAFKIVLGLKPGRDKARANKANGIGLIRGDTCDVAGQSVVIAMVHSLAKEARYPSHVFQSFGLVIPDEAHRMAADEFSQAMFRIPAKLRMGMSASPYRKDGREEVLHAHIGVVKVISEAAPMTPRVIVRDSPWECPMIRKTDKSGKMVLDDTGKPMMTQLPHTAGRTGHIERLLARHHGRNTILVDFMHQAAKTGRKLLIQSNTLEHLDTLRGLLMTRGVPSPQTSLYVGGLTKAQREQAKEAKYIFATYKMTSEATDIPTVDTLVMCAPKSDILQIVGRVTRFIEGKEPLIFDLLDDSSSVFKGYGLARVAYYKSIGAEVSMPAKHMPGIKSN